MIVSTRAVRVSATPVLAMAAAGHWGQSPAKSSDSFLFLEDLQSLQKGNVATAEREAGRQIGKIIKLKEEERQRTGSAF